MKIFINFVGLAVLLGVLGAGAWSLGYFSGPGEPVAFTVQKGENFASLANKLKSQGIIRSARAMRWYVNLRGKTRPLQRGEFELRTNMPVPAVVYALTEGKPIEHKFTVPEGFNVFQIAEELEAKGFARKADFLAAARSPELIQMLPGLDPSLPKPALIEGFLYPDTYLLQKVFTAKEIAQAMVAHFREVYKTVEGEIRSSPVAQELKLNPYQVLTLASIVEKETGNNDERPLVASIFVNRLRKRMMLQTDPTIIYGIYLEKGSWDGKIGRRNLDEPGPYNTYRSYGLPPSPISNPGLNAIRATLNPAQTDYLYFVSKGDGTHIFSKDYGAHSRAVHDTQLVPKAKEGKSWRNLPKDKRAH